jgi:hypothetical protein
MTFEKLYFKSSKNKKKASSIIKQARLKVLKELVSGVI